MTDLYVPEDREDITCGDWVTIQNIGTGILKRGQVHAVFPASVGLYTEIELSTDQRRYSNKSWRLTEWRTERKGPLAMDDRENWDQTHQGDRVQLVRRGEPDVTVIGTVRTATKSGHDHIHIYLEGLPSHFSPDAWDMIVIKRKVQVPNMIGLYVHKDCDLSIVTTIYRLARQGRWYIKDNKGERAIDNIESYLDDRRPLVRLVFENSTAAASPC